MEKPGHPEVTDLDTAVSLPRTHYQDVGRLEVAVQNPIRVKVVYALEDLKPA